MSLRDSYKLFIIASKFGNTFDNCILNVSKIKIIPINDIIRTIKKFKYLPNLNSFKSLFWLITISSFDGFSLSSSILDAKLFSVIIFSQDRLSDCSIISSFSSFL